MLLLGRDAMLQMFVNFLVTNVCQPFASITATPDSYSEPLKHKQEMVFELTNKHTTHTYVEERVVLRHFTATAHVVCAILHVLKLRYLRSVVWKALRQCENIMKGVELMQNRPLCT